MILSNIQPQTASKDSVATRDSSEVVKAYKLLPSTTIKSEDGAIIPKEVLEWSEIQPALVVNKETDSNLTTYILIGVVVLIILITTKFLLNRFNR